jgi:hypothetical protein
MNGRQVGPTLEASTTETQPEPGPRRKFDPVVHGLLIAFVVSLAIIPIPINNLFGLPAHPLLLHLPVVLIPLLAIAAVALMIRSEWRRRFGVALAITALVALAATNLTVSAGGSFKDAFDSGETLSAQVPPVAPPAGQESEGAQSPENAAIDKHGELGDQLRIAMIFFTGAIVLLVVADEARRRRIGGRLGQGAELLDHPRTALALRTGIGLLAAFTLVWVIRTGHEGAKAAWSSEPGLGYRSGAPLLPGYTGGPGEGTPPPAPPGTPYAPSPG